MIFLLLCLLSIFGFFSAIFLSGTIMCIIFSIFGVIALVASFAYLGLILLSSVSLLVYVGLFVVLFFVARNILPKENEKLKTAFFCILGLFITFILWYTISQDSTAIYHDIDRIVVEKDDTSMNFILIMLIISVGTLSAIFSKYNINNENKNDRNKFLGDIDDK